jgi:DNA-binding response OmpR family regulator
MERIARDGAMLFGQGCLSAGELAMARVLVLEDDGALGIVMRSALEAGGHEVMVAADGRIGLRVFGASKFDVVVTDMLMPDMDGIEIVRTLRAYRSSVRIIAISGGGALDHGDLLTTAMRLGADATLSKPFAPRALLDLVTAVLARPGREAAQDAASGQPDAPGPARPQGPA